MYKLLGIKQIGMTGARFTIRHGRSSRHRRVHRTVTCIGYYGFFMADPEQVAVLKRGVEAWNEYRRKHSRITEVDGATYLSCNLLNADLRGQDLSEANLANVELAGANLSRAILANANLGGQISGWPI